MLEDKQDIIISPVRQENYSKINESWLAKNNIKDLETPFYLIK